MKKRHIKPLTSVRFLAAMHVVVYHGAGYLIPLVPAALPFLANYLKTGYTGVNLFFVLSGFILAYTYLDVDRPTEIHRRKFWIARVARIYPIYIASLVVAAPLVIMHFLETNQPVIGAAKIAISGATVFAMMQAWIPPLRTAWNPPAWTLSVEAFFYLLFPLVAPWLFRLRPGRAKVAAVCVWLLGLAVPLMAALLLVPGALHVAANETMPKGDLLVLLRSAPILRFPEFVFGVLLARAYFPMADSQGESFESRHSNLLIMCAAALLLLALGFAELLPRLLVHVGLLDPLYGLLIVGLANARGPIERVLSLRWAVLLGEASYGIYILHVPIMFWISHSLPAGALKHLGPGFYLAYCVLVVGIAVFTLKRLENPARIWIRQMFARGEARPAAL